MGKWKTRGGRVESIYTVGCRYDNDLLEKEWRLEEKGRGSARMERLAARDLPYGRTPKKTISIGKRIEYIIITRWYKRCFLNNVGGFFILVFGTAITCIIYRSFSTQYGYPGYPPGW